MARAKGRHWVALWLVAFLVTTWLVYARQTAAIHAARELGDLRGRRANLDGHRADLERRIRAAVGRAVQVQILHGRRWAEEAQAQRTERIVLQARRGALYDRHGTPLAVTQETYHVGIAPNELRDPTADGALISRRLGLTARAWQL